jgi:uncharacterized protein YegJ (DUF2314 family)
MRTSYIYLILFLICWIYACKENSTKSVDPIVYAESNDPELEKAKMEALASINHFVSSYKLHSLDTLYQYSLKIDFNDKGNHEHMWVEVKDIDGDEYTGILGNDPQVVTNVKYGDRVMVTKDKIEDWLIYNVNKDSMEGGYSVKVFQSRQ